ncbi:bifunctional DNA primase/polymerase [Rhodococcus erythropolis]|uniref:bifunctional DNA primase/polymerase n=1 Tax=Rhodococcus erythropolis TaxID=1833 RepID=UPI0002FC536F
MLGSRSATLLPKNNPRTRTIVANNTSARAVLLPRKTKQCSQFRMQIIDELPSSREISDLRVPGGVNEMTLQDAALAYAKAGWFILPVKPGTKHPGSVVGNGWPSLSSRDPDQIRKWWWDRNPAYGIALHAGRSGAVIFDLDNGALAELPSDLRDGLASGVCQLSRIDNPDRGHYLFLNDESYGNSAGAFAPFGDVRGKNGVIIAAPTPHVDDDGDYRWVRMGEIPTLPDGLRVCLRAAPENEAPPMTSVELGEFFATYATNHRPGALSGTRKVFERNVDGGMSRHEALVNALPMAYREAIAGCYPTELATAELKEAFIASFADRSTGSGRNRPAPDEFARTARWAAAQALLADPAETLARLNRDETALREREEGFWDSRKELATLRQFAQARMVAPWALFGSALMRVLAVVPPRVVLPALVGSHGSVNSFVALVGPSGAGKSVSLSAARDAIDLKLGGGSSLHVRSVGSGEGLVDQFAAYDAKAKEYVGLRTRVLFAVDEVESLTAQAGRSGSTLFPTLRSAWAGESLGFANRDKTKAIPVEAHRYRLLMVVGVQPTKAQPILNDADGGTPQRFLWMPTSDPDAPEVEPAKPTSIVVGPWPHVTRGFTVSSPETAEVALVTIPATGKEFVELEIPECVKEEVRSQRRRVLRGHRDANPLDGHAQMTRLKVAVGLMVLNGRYDKVSDSDWELAGVVMEVSNRTRREVEQAIAAEAHQSNLARGRAEAHRDEAKAEVFTQGTLARVADRIVKKLSAVGEMERGKVKAFLARDKEFLDEAAELLELRGEVEMERYKARNGQPTWRIRLKQNAK